MLLLCHCYVIGNWRLGSREVLAMELGVSVARRTESDRIVVAMTVAVAIAGAVVCTVMVVGVRVVVVRAVGQLGSRGRGRSQGKCDRYASKGRCQ